MFPIVGKRRLNDTMTLMVVEAPYIARKAHAGQFIILRVNETGERIPLTIADYDREKGTVTIIFQKVGKTTMLLDTLNEGDAILDFIGPLGKASELEGYHKAAVIGGGAGCAIAYPQAKALKKLGTAVDMIAGFRSEDIIILEDEMRAASDHLYLMTDDGSNGHKGFVTDALKKNIEAGAGYDFVVVGVPLDVERVEVTPRVGVAELVGAEAVRPEIDIAFQGDAPVLVESQVARPDSPREGVVQLVVIAVAACEGHGGAQEQCGEEKSFHIRSVKNCRMQRYVFFAYCENPAYLCSPVCQAGKCGKI